MAKFYKNLSKQQVIDRLVAQDVHSIMLAAEDNDYSFLGDVLAGDGFLQYNYMKDDDLLDEYRDREDRIEELIADERLPYEV